MLFFLCPFGGFDLGIPADAVESLLVYDDGMSGGETGDVYFFLPRYFCLSEQEVHHGIVLKESGGTERNLDRKIFLVTSVEKIEDVPLEDIQKLPGILNGIEKAAFFTGLRFHGKVMTLFVDPLRLLPRLLYSDACCRDSRLKRRSEREYD
jgi:hypothetical protein